jgi:hypothetical protein
VLCSIDHERYVQNTHSSSGIGVGVPALAGQALGEEPVEDIRLNSLAVGANVLPSKQLKSKATKTSSSGKSPPLHQGRPSASGSLPLKQIASTAASGREVARGPTAGRRGEAEAAGSPASRQRQGKEAGADNDVNSRPAGVVKPRPPPVIFPGTAAVGRPAVLEARDARQMEEFRAAKHFNCTGRGPGLYADVNTGCKVTNIFIKHLRPWKSGQLMDPEAFWVVGGALHILENKVKASGLILKVSTSRKHLQKRHMNATESMSRLLLEQRKGMLCLLCCLNIPSTYVDILSD